jgi:NADPH:quinone reductase-like Zn-dependent oxidoreductase
LGRLVKEGKLVPVVDKVVPFDLAGVQEGFAYLMAGRAKGKVVVTMKD